MSANAFPNGAAIAYIATGGVYPDALAGGPAAAAVSAPVLLVNSTSVPTETSSELRRLGVSQIVMLGGEGSISAGVARELQQIAPTVRRSGPDRYATAAAISRSAYSPNVSAVYVATGTAFQDALVAATAAASQSVPLLLTAADNLPASIRTELERLRPHEIIIVGDDAAISSAVQAQLGEIAATRRIAGSGAAHTAALVCRDAALQTNRVYVATSENFPDALAGAAVAGRVPGCLLYVTRDAIPSVTADEIRASGVSKVTVMGGRSAISDEVLWELDGLAAG